MNRSNTAGQSRRHGIAMRSLKMVRMSGTYRTCRAKLTMSADWGKVDHALGRVEVRKKPKANIFRCWAA